MPVPPGTIPPSTFQYPSMPMPMPYDGFQPQQQQQSGYPVSAPPYSQTYGAVDQTVTAAPTGPTVINKEIIVIGGCPSCRVGVLDDNYTCCGICCAIFCFPIGILCCLACKNKRCKNCGAEF